MPRSRKSKDQTSFEFIIQEDSRQQARQRESERKLLAALNSCSAETKQNFADILSQ